MSNLNPDRALIFRIVHVDNVPWILDHRGLASRSSPVRDQNYISIGNPELIARRSQRIVPVPPGGTLSDYVPFYFTPFSIMMYNIRTGFGGIALRENRAIAIFVSSIHRPRELKVPHLFTNQHAYAVDTDFFHEIADLHHIDWPLLQNRDFKTDDANPGKQLRYQAEALAHRHVPLEAILGIACHNQTTKEKLDFLIEERGLSIKVRTTPIWFFP